MIINHYHRWRPQWDSADFLALFDTYSKLDAAFTLRIVFTDGETLHCMATAREKSLGPWLRVRVWDPDEEHETREHMLINVDTIRAVTFDF